MTSLYDQSYPGKSIDGDFTSTRRRVASSEEIVNRQDLRYKIMSLVAFLASFSIASWCPASAAATTVRLKADTTQK